MKKKSLLVISFGSSYAETRKKNITATEDALARAFPDYTLKRAFTSNVIINKLKERDHLAIDTVSEAIQKLLAEGYREVLAQPLHIINGEEYHLILADLQPYAQAFTRLAIGSPLLTHHRDYVAVVNALREVFPKDAPDEAIVLMGHGSDHPADSAYAALDYVFKDEDLPNVHVGTVEGYPTLDSIIKRLQAGKIRKVTLVPFMLVAGDHAENDMACDDEDCWKSILTNKGYEVEARIVGLGEIEKIRQIYISHARAALEKESK
ncbi:MAG: sirohydrochlorin cobaltochelatase [Chloroflexota bacterium]